MSLLHLLLHILPTVFRLSLLVAFRLMLTRFSPFLLEQECFLVMVECFICFGTYFLP